MRFLQWMMAAALLVAPATASTISVSPNSGSGAWGVGTNGTFGQTITAPADSQLLDFTFLLGIQVIGSGPIAFQAYVFAWDDTNAAPTGSSLYSSAVSSITAPVSGYTPVTFSPNITLTPGSQYVLFFSTSGLTVGAPTSTIRWGLNTSNPYGGGQHVYTGRTASTWTAGSWGVLPSLDLATTVNFGPAPVPEPSTHALCVATLAALELLRRKRKAAKDEFGSSLAKPLVAR